MTFFDWKGDDGSARVSSYLWVYVAITAVCTGITLGLWYYFVVYRKPARITEDEETAISYDEKRRSDYVDKCTKVLAYAKNLLSR